MPTPRGMSALPAQPALLALVTLLTLEFLRASGPLLDAVASSGGTIRAAGIALAAYAAPVLVGLLAKAVGSVRAALLCTLGLVLVRIGVQAQEQPTLPAVAAGAVLGIAAVTALASQVVGERGGIPAATAIVVGGALEIGVRTASGTWDPMWRPGAWPWIFTAAECLIAVNLLLTIRRRMEKAVASPALAAIGLYLALFVLVLGSPAYLASRAGVPLALASAFLLAGSAAAIVFTRWWPVRATPVAVALLAGAVATAYWARGWIVAPAVLAAQAFAAVALGRALSTRSRRGLSLAALGGGLGYAATVLAFQIHYDRPLPFDNRWVVVIAAVALGLIGLRSAPRRHGSAIASVATVLALLIVPVAYAVTKPGVPKPKQPGDRVTLMSWNVAYGANNDGVVDLEAVAKAVEAVGPDVAVLQEVNRGWPIGGGTDMAEWLARRLRMAYAWSPAADGQFGNLLLTRLPMSDVTAERLPYVQPPQQRSYVAATLTLQNGGRLRVVGTHLQHRKENARTREAQIDRLLQVAGDTRPLVIAGDMNMWPQWPEPQKLRDKGFVSAQDATGHGGEFTSPTPVADNRVDWIWSTPDVAYNEFGIRTDIVASDHFPLVTTATVPAPPRP